MRKKLTDRIHDKDTSVRVQAVVALSKFQVSAFFRQFYTCKIVTRLQTNRILMHIFRQDMTSKMVTVVK